MKSKNIEIDVAGICSIVHNCTGCGGELKRCCSSYEVTITTKELENINGCIPLAARFCPNLKLDHGYENVFEEISSNLFCIDTNEDGVCAFGYFKDTKILCSLHSAADKFGISFKNAKPRSCLLWPLAIFEGTTNILSIQDDAFEFTCNTRSGKDTFSLCPSIARNIEWAFGAAFKDRVHDAVNKRLLWTTIPLDGLSGR